MKTIDPNSTIKIWPRTYISFNDIVTAHEKYIEETGTKTAYVVITLLDGRKYDVRHIKTYEAILKYFKDRLITL